jgi:hypothetical protein
MLIADDDINVGKQLLPVLLDSNMQSVLHLTNINTDKPKFLPCQNKSCIYATQDHLIYPQSIQAFSYNARHFHCPSNAGKFS